MACRNGGLEGGTPGTLLGLPSQLWGPPAPLRLSPASPGPECSHLRENPGYLLCDLKLTCPL